MRLIYTSLIIILTLFSTIVTGCQGGPSEPCMDPDQGLSGRSIESDGSLHHCLGYCELVFDTRTGDVDVVPVHSGNIHLNVVGILNTTMGIAVAGIPSEHDPANGLFVFDVTLTHPFGTKPQLAGFDVKGILMTPGTLTIDSVVFADDDETRLENADGYTRWWNPTEFTTPGVFGYTEGNLANAEASELTATVNPFKYFADCLSATASVQEVYFVDMDADNGRGVFTAGRSNTRRYRIRFPMDPGPQIRYGYAVDASWMAPSPNPPDEIPDDFPVEANQPEAYYLLAQATANTLYYDTETETGGGVLRLQINVHDWQGQAAGDIRSEIGAVRIFAPGLMDSAVDADFLNESEIKARYTVDLFGYAVPTGPGEELVIAGAECLWPHIYDQGIGQAPDSLISAWYVTEVEIIDPECEADSDNTFANATPMDFGTSESGIVCPVTDETDYYTFDIPVDYGAEGDIRLYSDAAPTTVTLLNASHIVLAEATTSSSCSISLDSLELLPGTYYIGISADPTGDVRPYLLDLDAYLVNASPCGAVDVTPEDLMVEPDYVYMNDNYAFLIDDNYIWIYDLTDPSSPDYINRFEHDYSFKYSDFRYPYCYGLKNRDISDDNQIDMIDFTDPVNPVIYEDLVHFTGDTGPAFCMDEQYIFVEHGDTAPYEIQIYDWASDPFNPTLQATIDSTLPPAVFDITEIPTYGKYLIVGGYLEMWAYNIEHLGTIFEVPPYSFAGSTQVTCVESDDEHVYVIHRTGTWDHYLYSLKFDDFGTSLIYYDDILLTNAGYSLMRDGSWLYLGETGALSVYDLSTPTEPALDNTYDLVDYGWRMAKSGDTLCIIPGIAGLEFFNVANPSSPIHYPHLPVCNRPEAIAATGDYLFVADSAEDDGRILTIDISDPESAVVAAEFSLPDQPYYIDAYGTYVLTMYSEDFLDKLRLLDASDPYNLSVITGMDYGGMNIVGLKIIENIIILATDIPSIRFYEYTGTDLTDLGSVGLSDTPLDIATGFGHVYVTTYSDIEIIDITTPSSPSHAGTYTPIVEGEECRVADSYLYITGDDTLEVADLSDPSNPAYVTHLAVSGYYDIDEITIHGQYVYLTGCETPIYAVQRLPIEAPSFACYLRDSDDYSCYDLLYHENFLYEMNDYEGIHIFDLY